MKKIVTVLGARPQFIKAASLSRVIREKAQFEEVIVHTGQHFDENMNAVFFREMNLPRPKYELNINGLSHGAMTGQMLERIEGVLLDERPDAVLVYGDTNSTLAGALAARKMNIRIVHVEAGLRSFNGRMPEEINRILTDRMSDLLCCPTEKAVQNLHREGFGSFPARIHKSGDIMKDSTDYYSRFSGERSTIISDLQLENGSFALATIHREENTKSPQKLRAIFQALDVINETTPIILPLHPGTKKRMQILDVKTQVRCIQPVGYFDMMELLRHCQWVATDSGGLQKEAYFHQKNCLILREETEWEELLDRNVSVLAGTSMESILETYGKLAQLSIDFTPSIYGNNVAESIHDAIAKLIHVEGKTQNMTK